MRTALGVEAGRNDADALAFQDGKGIGLEVQHHMADVGFSLGGGDAHIAGDARRHRSLAGIDIGEGLGGAGRCRHPSAGGGGGDLQQVRDLGRSLDDDRVMAGMGFGQFLPAELIFHRPGSIHQQPVVDGAGGTGRDAGAAAGAGGERHHVLVGVVGDGADRTGFLAGVAADADHRVDQMLAAEFHGGLTGV